MEKLSLIFKLRIALLLNGINNKLNYKGVLKIEKYYGI